MRGNRRREAKNHCCANEVPYRNERKEHFWYLFFVFFGLRRHRGFPAEFLPSRAFVCSTRTMHLSWFQTSHHVCRRCRLPVPIVSFSGWISLTVSVSLSCTTDVISSSYVEIVSMSVASSSIERVADSTIHQAPCKQEGFIHDRRAGDCCRGRNVASQRPPIGLVTTFVLSFFAGCALQSSCEIVGCHALNKPLHAACMITNWIVRKEISKSVYLTSICFLNDAMRISVHRGTLQWRFVHPFAWMWAKKITRRQMLHWCVERVARCATMNTERVARLKGQSPSYLHAQRTFLIVVLDHGLDGLAAGCAIVGGAVKGVLEQPRVRNKHLVTLRGTFVHVGHGAVGLEGGDPVKRREVV